MSEKVGPPRAEGNIRGPWVELEINLATGDIEKATAVVRARTADEWRTDAPDVVAGSLIATLRHALDTEHAPHVALLVMQTARAWATASCRFDSETDEAVRARRACVLEFCTDVESAAAVLPNWQRTERVAKLEQVPVSPAQQREVSRAVDLAGKLQSDAEEREALANRILDEAAQVYLGRTDALSEDSVNAAIRLCRLDGSGELGLVEKQAMAAESVVALAKRLLSAPDDEHEALAIESASALVVGLGIAREGRQNSEWPGPELLSAARVCASLEVGSWVYETMQLCATLGLMRRSDVKKLSSPRSRVANQAFSNFESMLSKRGIKRPQRTRAGAD